MEKKIYITPIVEQSEYQMFSALCTSTFVSGTPGGSGSGKPGGTQAPRKRLF